MSPVAQVEKAPASTEKIADSPGKLPSFVTPPVNHTVDVDSSTTAASSTKCMGRQFRRNSLGYADTLPFGLGRFILTGLLLIYAVLTGSHVFNWPPWSDILRRSAVFASKCPSLNGQVQTSCTASEDAIAGILVLAACMMFCFTLVAGIMLDVLGPRTCCLFGCSVALVGWGLLTLSSQAPGLVYVGFALVGAAFDPAFFGILSTANLFPGRESTVVGLFGAARSLSNFLPLGLDWIMKKSPGFTFTHIAVIFVVLFLGCIAMAFYLVAPKPYERISKSPKCDGELERNSAEAKMEKDIPTGSDERTRSLDQGTDAENFSTKPEAAHPRKVGKLEHIAHEILRVKDYLGLWSYFPIIIVMATNVLRNNFYLGSSEKMLGSIEIWLSIINVLAFIPGPIMGFLVDRFGPLFVIAVINTTNTLVFVILIIVDLANLSDMTVAGRVLRILAVLLSFPGIGFLVSQMYCYIGAVFPARDLGKLAGFASAVGGILGLLANPMLLADRKSLWHMNLVCAGLGLLCYFCVFLLWLPQRRFARKAAAAGEPLTSTPNMS